MHRGALIALALALAGAGIARAEDEPLKQALALEASIQKVVEKAEVSVACILVSRSDAYAHWKQGPGQKPGQLGRFDPDRAASADRNQNLEKLREVLKRLNLAALDAVPDSYGTGVVI